MPDVFISYSRTDKTFAQNLCKALEEHSRDVWIDWEDIPPSSDWLARVFAGIESSKVFVPIITPHFAASRVCGLEVARAIEHGKRLVPVVHRVVKPETLHPALRSIDCIRFEEGDGAAAAIVTVQKALDTDLEWLDMHTRLTVRSREWHAGNRHKSLLLHGRDLSQAKRALDAARRSPDVTDLQREYVGASRKAQTRFRRALSAGGALALAASALLGLIAWRQNQQATSRALAGAAVSHLGADGELALLLATEAGRVWKTDQAEAALRQALLASHGRLTLRGHEGPVRSAELSPDETRLLSTSDDGTARLWKVAADEPPLILSRGDPFAPAAAFGPDGRQVATAGPGGAIRLWTVTDGAAFGAIQHGSGIRAIAFDAAGDRLLTHDQDGGLQVWDARGLSALWKLEALYPQSATFSADGSRVLAATTDAVLIWDAATGKEVLRIGEQTGTVYQVVFSHDQRSILSSWDFADARLWDAQTGAAGATLSGHEEPVDRIAVDPSGRRAATSTRSVYTESGGGPTTIGDKSIRVWSLPDGNATAVLRGHSRHVTALAFDRTGDFIVSASQDQTARVWDAETGRTVRVLRGHAGELNAAAFNRDGTLVVTAGDDHTIRVWQSGLGSARASDGVLRAEWIEDGRFSAGGRFVTVRAADGTTQIVDVATGRSDPLPAGADEDGVRGERSRDDKWLLTVTGDVATASGGQTAHVFELPSGQPRFVLSHDGPVYGGRFDAHATRMVTASEDGTARLWSTTDGKELARLDHHNRVLDAAFSSAGDRVVTASRDTTAVVWNVETGTRIAELIGHEDSVLTAEFSPDGRLVASVGADRSVRLWDPRTGEELAVFGWPEWMPRSVRFSPDCGWLELVGSAGAVHRFDAAACGDIDALSMVAKGRTDRALAADDLRAALGQ